MVEEGINTAKCQNGSKNVEDEDMERCLKNVNIIAIDSHDSGGRARLHSSYPEDVLIPKSEMKSERKCCSDNAISFRNLDQIQIYVMEYLVYHLRPYGIAFMPQPLPQKVSLIELGNVNDTL